MLQRTVLAVSFMLITLAQGQGVFKIERNGVKEKVLELAKKNIGSTEWSYKSPHYPGPNKDKCNIFVADIVTAAGGNVPQRYTFIWSPIGTGEWCNPNSSYLKTAKCWQNVPADQVDEDMPTSHLADVACFSGHMGFVTGNKLTTSAAADKVVENDWGFRPGQKLVYWRWVC